MAGHAVGAWLEGLTVEGLAVLPDESWIGVWAKRFERLCPHDDGAHETLTNRARGRKRGRL